MFKNISNISVSSKLGNFARTARSKTVLAAAVATTGLGLSSISRGALYPTITAITTTMTTGTTTSVNGVVGVGASYSQFQAPTDYTMNYAGDDQKITSVTAGGVTYTAGAVTATATADYNTAFGASDNNDNVWEVGTGGTGSNVVNLKGPNLGGTSSGAVDKALSGNNILVGADNVFSNTGNPVGDNTDIVRIDEVFPTAITTSSTKAFAIYDRGPTTDHDAFQIAAITSINPITGAPTSYGPLVSFADGTWGTTNVVSSQQEDILRMNNSSSSPVLHPADLTNQPIGGVLIPTTSLNVAAGTTIYGYSLFSPDVPSNATSAQLLNTANSAIYPEANSTSTGGGLDPVGAIGVLYTQTAVPEPASASLMILAAGGYLARRPKRKPAQV
jgi:hypothetical protein